MTAWHCTILAWLAACLLAIAPTFSLLHASATVQADPVLCSAGGVRVEAGSARQRTLVLLTSACPLCALQSHLPPWPVLVPQLTMHMVAGLLPLMPALTVTADCALPPATGPPGFVRR
ncbi:hypothetical protein HNQ50_001236 [Silvimonas terrae]|uniref:DUF2946 family protein n=1 Tax=Silvimonas terrae TaxID=300266 RepID=A0A840RD56_9NEIS|nr:hypothetical protein [Silvimonas terrae]MBB5190514.1 hypothetical protein [Silvimonas terrae]